MLLVSAAAIHMESAANLKRLRLKVQSEVRSALIDLHNAQEQIGLHRERLAKANKIRHIVKADYEVKGTELLTRLNETQRDVIAADANLALARIRLRQAWSDLNAATARRADTDSAEESTASLVP